MSPHRCAAVSCQRGGNVITNLHLVIWLLWGVALCASHLYLLLHSSFIESVIYKEQKSWVSSLHCEQISSIQLFVMWLPPRAESCSQQTHSHECRFAKVRAEEEARARAPLWYSNTVHPCSRWLRQPRPGFRQTAAGARPADVLTSARTSVRAPEGSLKPHLPKQVYLPHVPTCRLRGGSRLLHFTV